MTGFLIYLTQITIILAVVLLLGKLNARKAAKAHAILLAGVVMILAMPVFSMVAAQLGLGLLPAQPILTASDSNVFVAEPLETFPQSIDGVHPTLIAQPDAVLNKVAATDETPVLNSTAVATTANPVSIWSSLKTLMLQLNWLWVLSLVWVGFSLRILFKLILGSVAAISIRKSAVSVTDEKLLAALDSAKQDLGITRDVQLAAAEKANCPMIWCWSKPIIIIPTRFLGRADVDGIHWQSVFCHELAHLARRDHLSSFAAEIPRMLFPWHPLVQIARRNLHRYSELACDNWAVQTADPADYAESILNFAPAPAMPLLTPMATRPHELKQRVQHILSLGKSQPSIGQTWLSLLILLSLTLASLTALARANSAVEPKPTIAVQEQDEWVQKLKNTAENSPWHVGYNFGMQLAQLPDDQARQILDAAWNDIPGSVRAQILKGFLPAFQKSPDLNPGLYDVLNLGMVSKQEKVREFAEIYLSWMTLHKFESGSKEYKQWYKSIAGKSAEDVTRNECERLINEMAAMKKTTDIRKSLKLIVEADSNIENCPLIRDALVEAGLPMQLEGWVKNKIIKRGHPAVVMFKGVNVEGAFTDAEKSLIRELMMIDSDARWFVGANLGKQLAALPGSKGLELLKASWDDITPSARPQILKGFQPWMTRDGTLNESYFDVMDFGARSDDKKARSFAMSYVGAMTFRDFGSEDYDDWRESLSASLTPEDILAMESKRFVESLAELDDESAVAAMQTLSNARGNIRELPMLQQMLIKAGAVEKLTEFLKRNPDGDVVAAANETLKLLSADENVERETSEADTEFIGFPAVERTVDGNDKKRYFQIGPSKTAKQPADGWKLLLILPGGDGSAEFHPFCRRIHKNALPDGYVVAQLVAPKWSNNRNRVVWPTKLQRTSSSLSRLR